MSGNSGPGRSTEVRSSMIMERCVSCEEPILAGERHVVVATDQPRVVRRFHLACASPEDAGNARMQQGATLAPIRDASGA
jgi:hypothetical protein